MVGRYEMSKCSELTRMRCTAEHTQTKWSLLVKWEPYSCKGVAMKRENKRQKRMSKTQNIQHIALVGFEKKLMVMTAVEQWQ